MSTHIMFSLRNKENNFHDRALLKCCDGLTVQTLIKLSFKALLHRPVCPNTLGKYNIGSGKS